MKLPSYPLYRISKIKWVQQLPAEWEECSAKINYLIQLGKMLQNDPSGLEDVEITYLKALHVNWNRVTINDLPKMWASPSELKQYAVTNGDLLVCEGGEVGRAAIIRSLDESAIIQNALHRVRDTTRGDVRYFVYLLRHIADAGWFAILCNKATIAHLTSEKLGAIYMPVPTVSEQQQIAAFLDWKTGQIDALIARKRELLEKLKEKRLAVITQAVTKGLNPAAPMRDSGIPWLGQVPEHWEVLRIATCSTKLTNGYVGPTRDILTDEGVRYLQSLHIKNNCIVINRPFFVSEEWSLEHSRSILKEGDVLIVQTGDIGQVAVVTKEFEGCNCHALIIVEPELGRLHGHFLSWVLNSNFGAHNLKSIQTGALHPHLNCTVVHDVRLPVPPLIEQLAITDYINAEIAKIDLMTSKVDSALDRLTEYRTALITAATTGKIDVRRVQIPEP